MILIFNLHDLRTLNLRRHAVDTSSIVATLYVNLADAGADPTRQRTAAPYSEYDGDDNLDSDWRCGDRWPGVGHVHHDIPGVRFVEVPRALSAWDVLDPRQG